MSNCRSICLFVFFAFVSLIFNSSCSKKEKVSPYAKEEGKGIASADSAGLKLVLHTSTFKDLSLVQIVDKAKEFKVRLLEVSLDFPIGGKWGDARFDTLLLRKEQEDIKEFFLKQDVEIVALDISDVDDEISWERVFNFAQSMGLKYLTCNPRQADLKEVSLLANSYNVKVGVRNGDKSAGYLDLLLEDMKDSSPLVGACADITNWYKEGLDHIECLERLEQRIISVRMNDLNPTYGLDVSAAKSVVWGNGILDLDAVILTLKNQNYQGYLVIDYSSDADPTADLISSLLSFDVTTNIYYNNFQLVK